MYWCQTKHWMQRNPNIMESTKRFVRFSLTCGMNCLIPITKGQRYTLIQECLVWILYLEDHGCQPALIISLQNTVNRKEFDNLTEDIQHFKSCLRICADQGTWNKFQAVCHLCIGISFARLGKNEDAMNHYKTCLDIASKIGDKFIKATALDALASVCVTVGKFREALTYYKESLKEGKETGNTLLEMTNLINIGSVCHSLSKLNEAKDYLEQGLSLATRLGSLREQALCYLNLALVSKSQSSYEESINYCNKALPIAKDLHDKGLELQALAINGSALRSLGNHQCLNYYERSLNIAKEIGDRSKEAEIYGGMGGWFEYQGDYHKAIENLKKSLAIGEEFKNKHIQAQCYSEVGKAYRLLGKYNLAILNQEKSLAIFRDLGDEIGEAQSILGLGNIFSVSGNVKVALDCYQKTLVMAQDMQHHLLSLIATQQMANVFGRLKNDKKAIEWSQKGLQMATEIGEIHSQACLYLNIGNSFLNMDAFEEALQNYQKGLKIAINTGNKELECASLINTGLAQLHLQSLYESLKTFKRALEIAKDINGKENEASAYFGLGYNYILLAIHKEEDETPENIATYLELAEERLKESIKCFESIYDHVGDRDAIKIYLVDTYTQAYNLLENYYIAKKQYEQALLTSETSRSRALEDLLGRKYNLETDLQTEATFTYIDVDTILSTPGSCILFYGLPMADTHISCFLLRGGKPLFTNVSRCMQELSKPNTITSSNNYIDKLICQAFAKLRVRQVAECEDRSMGPDMATRCIDPFDDDDGEQDDEDPLETLFTTLVGPFQGMLTHYDEIIIIPRGPLFTVPYAALRDPKSKRFLSDDKRIRLAPSLTTLKILKESQIDYQKTSGALIVGDPNVGKVIFQDQLKVFSRLSGAKKEAELIAEMLGVSAITGEQATKQVIMSRLKDGVAIIHFAAHGSTDGEIALSPSKPPAGDYEIPTEDDYLLTIKEVQEIGIKAQLVVLSCCHSGRGEIRAEGVVGMSRAFLAAGARAVLGSLWAIADQETMLFMKSFYIHLKQGDSAGTSLHKAMNDLRKTINDKPMFWAPFFLIGDDVTIYQPEQCH